MKSRSEKKQEKENKTGSRTRMTTSSVSSFARLHAYVCVFRYICPAYDLHRRCCTCSVDLQTSVGMPMECGWPWSRFDPHRFFPHISPSLPCNNHRSPSPPFLHRRFWSSNSCVRSYWVVWRPKTFPIYLATQRGRENKRKEKKSEPETAIHNFSAPETIGSVKSSAIGCPSPRWHRRNNPNQLIPRVFRIWLDCQC